MEDLLDSDILELHKIVEDRFGIVKGAKDPGLVKAIAERPSQKLFGEFVPYDDVFTKAASIMEGIIRMHPFYDGNKRTALLAVITYLEINDYYMVIPLSAVRFTVKIAKTFTKNDEENRKLIHKIAKWIRNLSDNDFNEWIKIHDRRISRPVSILIALGKIHLTWISRFLVSKWMAFDIYPEYESEATNIADFLDEMMDKSFSHDLLARKKLKEKGK